MASMQGHLLVATKELCDPNFFRAVVLLVEHNDEGAWGLVLNRETDTKVRDAWESVSNVPCLSDQPLHQGGPCEGPLMVIHRHSEINGNQFMDGIFLSVNSDDVEQLVTVPDDDVRYFVGYAGWSESQLESELATGSWFTIPARKSHIFDPNEDRWRHIMREIGRNELLGEVDPKIIPHDPLVN